jgi:hypothetical protein
MILKNKNKRDYMNVPEGFLGEESRMLFNNFNDIKAGSGVGLRKEPP